MQTTYQSANFKQDDIASVYIAYGAYGVILKQYDVNAAGRTIRESIINPADIDPVLLAKAFALHNQAFNQVKIS